ncbi:MAG: OsmC family protein [Gammaproteobacteria bacterium]|uniref:OsmC family protein n=1 Tax=Limnobacter sp. TaxID=2003368 RepID=UPI001DF52ABC|nr:OsmC family protein [Limnobacter sp.]MBU0785003.1 OsmC family protein [Gammaproteobacteria bacterium]MBU0849042.1 OsmC family protein [Gammaproteobacteria bacterium]MBU1266666.1 OsmC family protein [Gammaproteobacteria bacterium]MBU1529868.1 OsmC family protein [Gammaproteobacteria bacterium]MBU1781379.1 OsmC family protein [Gammaproteobacteria bacterium]
MEVVYSPKATSTGGREGRSVTEDGCLNVQLSTPKELGGAGGPGTNPKGVGFAITVDMSIKLDGMDKADAKALVEKAHQVCPYSNATRNNVDVKLTVV